MEQKFKKLSFWRAKARFIFRVLLAVGFTVQSILYMRLYLEYQSTVELEVLQPPDLELPAITVCNVNEIRSTPYCDMFPDNCGTPESNPYFCDRFPEYCKLVNNSKIVPLVPVGEFRKLSRYKQQMLGHQYEDLVTYCQMEIDGDSQNCSSSPILVPHLSFSYEIPFNCYMLNSLYGRPDDKPEVIPTSSLIEMKFNLEVAEYHPAHLSRGAQLCIHSPYHIPSAVGEGLFLNLGTLYRIYVRLSDKLLLPSPFKSNCTDYMKQWKLNGGKGPVTEKMCKELCKLRISMERFGCADWRIDYPHNYTICTGPNMNFTRSVRPGCAAECSSPCKMRKFEVQVQEANSEGSRKACLKAHDLSCATIVQIIFENLEITTFKYVPRYEPIGILSFIGGYVGLWLGISLLTVYDFLETRIFRTVTLLNRKLRSHKRELSKNSVTPMEKIYINSIDLATSIRHSTSHSDENVKCSSTKTY